MIELRVNRGWRAHRPALLALVSITAGCGAARQQTHSRAGEAGYVEVVWSERQVSPAKRVIEANVTNLTDSYLSVRIDKLFILSINAMDVEPSRRCTSDRGGGMVAYADNRIDPTKPCDTAFIVLSPKSEVTLGDIISSDEDDRNPIGSAECVPAYEVEYAIHVMDEACKHPVQVVRDTVSIPDAE